MLAGIGTGSALVIILIVVALTPPSDEEQPAPIAATSPRPSEIVLPTAPADATIEELQEEARLTAEELLERFPQEPEAYRIMALLQKALRQTDDAAECWRKALELAPADSHARVGLAVVCMDQGDDETAVQTLEEAITLGCSSSEVFNTLATALIRLGNFDRTVEILQKGLAVHARSAKSWLLLGQAQIQQGKIEQAELSLKQAIELRPEYTDAYYALASVCARLGDRDAGIAHRKRFAELKAHDRQMEDRLVLVPDIDKVRQRTAATLCGASAVWVRHGDSAKADGLLLRAVAVAPGLPEPYKVLASLYQAQGKLADAMAVQRRLVHVDPGNVVNHVNLANLCFRNGDPSSAVAVLQQAIDTHPDAAIAHSCLAKLSMEMGNPETASAHAQEWIRLEPTPDAYMLLAAACRQLNDPAGSENALQEMRKLKSK